jgi:hypothetical protein
MLELIIVLAIVCLVMALSMWTRGLDRVLLVTTLRA